MENRQTSVDHDAHRVHLFTSESVSEGHPDKVSDTIADAVLDAYLAQDPHARVACEVLCKKDHVVLAGEVDSLIRIDHAAIAREAIRKIGYTDPGTHFNAEGVTVLDLIGKQSSNIAQGILGQGDLGAGDQGLVFGYATDETEELLPLPLVLSHRLTLGLTQARRNGQAPWLRPDAKAQVSVRYEGITPVAVDTVVVSTQHAANKPVKELQDWLRNTFIPATLADHWRPDITIHANPAGDFVEGGPEADCGVTGRKIIVDTYGGMARHGGGAFSGKDATKVDRSAAYFARFVARQIVLQGIARRAELQVCYAIGVAQPVALRVDTFGSGDQAAAERFAKGFDYSPAAIIERLGLRRPIYSASTNYGHFGKVDLPWEAEALEVLELMNKNIA